MAKVMISLPDDLLGRIDREARRRQTSRSGLLQEAARHEIGGVDPEEFDAGLDRAREALGGIEPFDTTAAIRADRDERAERDRRRI
jgi:hypothetical protein